MSADRDRKIRAAESAARASLGDTAFESVTGLMDELMSREKPSLASSMKQGDILSAMDEMTARAAEGSPVAKSHEDALQKIAEAVSFAQRGDRDNAILAARDSILLHRVNIPNDYLSGVIECAKSKLKSSPCDAAATIVFTTFGQTFPSTEPLLSTPNKVIAILEGAQAAHPRDAYICWMMATMFVSAARPNLDRALKLLVLAHQLNPELTIEYNIGRVLEMLNRFDEAIVYYRKFLEHAHVDEREYAEGCYSLAALVNTQSTKVNEKAGAISMPCHETLELFTRGQAAERTRLKMYPPCTVPSKSLLQIMLRVNAVTAPKGASSTCASCGKSAINLCAKCHASCYCSVTCQKAHWGTHKLVCKAAEKEKQAVVISPPTSVSQVMALTVPALKEVLKAKDVDYSTVTEKSDLIALVLTTYNLLD